MSQEFVIEKWIYFKLAVNAVYEQAPSSSPLPKNTQDQVFVSIASHFQVVGYEPQDGY